MRDAILKLLGTCRKDTYITYPYNTVYIEYLGMKRWPDWLLLGHVLSQKPALQVCKAVGLGPCCGRLP